MSKYSSKNSAPNDLASQDFDRNDLVVELPAQPSSPYPERIPLGYDPMGDIHLRGRAMRGLAGGRIPWWILISGWILFGVPTLFLLSELIRGNLAALPALLMFGIFIMILWRGTAAKRTGRKRRQR